MKKKTKGVIYIATGENYVNEVLVSAASLKKHMPDLPVTLFSDIDVKSAFFENIIRIDNPAFCSEDKVRNIGKSPYDYTLFLDTDTYVCDNFSELFDLLDRFDVAAAHNFSIRYCKRNSGKKITKSFSPFNSGVILFKKSPRTKRLFSDWLKLYLKDKKKKISELYSTEHLIKRGKIMRGNRINLPDQPSFREAVYESDVRISILARNYNLKWAEGFINDKVKIIHYRGGVFDTIEKSLNSSLSPRIYTWRYGKLKVFKNPKFNPGEYKRINKFIRVNNFKKILGLPLISIRKLKIRK